VSDAAVLSLLRQAPFSFVGTIENVYAATMSGVTIDDWTVVVHVDRVLHAPPIFARFGGQRITLQLAQGNDTPVVGYSAAFFVEVGAIGESVEVTEVGRLPLEDLQPQMTRAATVGELSPFAALEERLQADSLREHSSGAQAVVLGRVVKLEQAVPMGFSEHDPGWWRATLDVRHVEQGELEPGEVGVLYASSGDVAWWDAPKPRAGQDGVWLLHATEGELADFAPFQILHPEDVQAVQSLDVLRGGG
jgi:hypothetical protein